MSRFIAMARDLSALSGQARFDEEDLARIGAGRQIARELISALQAGEKDPDLLASLTLLAGQAAGETLRGYFRELQAEISKAVQS